MFKRHPIAIRRRWLAGSALVGALSLTGSAGAHFRLISPGNVVMQSTDGSPQKMGPCGNESPQTATNVVTAFRPGDTVTVQLTETVFHPGHYRAALAVNSITELPPDPVVTAGSSACGSAAIQTTPVFPVLADGMLPHTQAFTGQQSFQVKLPTNVTCTNCTLQIVEFMSSHGAPCFYYHCAKISIGAAPDGGTSVPDGGRDAAGGSGGSTGGGGSAGSAGASGKGGADGSGGTAGGGGAGGSNGSGGVTSGGKAGSGGASAGASGAGTSGAAGADGGNTSGCSCRIGSTHRDGWKGAGALLALSLGATRRRSRRPDARRAEQRARETPLAS
jgi:MYXO-CTERM domain-containing protein